MKRSGLKTTTHIRSSITWLMSHTQFPTLIPNQTTKITTPTVIYRLLQSVLKALHNPCPLGSGCAMGASKRYDFLITGEGDMMLITHQSWKLDRDNDRALMRFKCRICPDFDFCGSCYLSEGTVRHQHARSSFFADRMV